MRLMANRRVLIVIVFLHRSLFSIETNKKLKFKFFNNAETTHSIKLHCSTCGNKCRFNLLIMLMNNSNWYLGIINVIARWHS